MRGLPLHALLFALTVVSTLAAGSIYIQGYDLFAEFPTHLLAGLAKGVPFSLPLLVILGSHEMAHYMNSKRHGVDATLPFFIPFPNIFGTLGAVIKIKSPILNRRALVDIGASGPLVGFVFALVACAVGLSLSTTVPEVALQEGEFALGPSLLFNGMVALFVGNIPPGQTVDLHPVAVAGWVGLFVTSINLMPVGQLDGGHISYAFLGRHHPLVSRIFIALLAVMGLFMFAGWLIWAVLLIIIGTRHPPVLDSYYPLDLRRKLIGAASLVVFIISFPPVPVHIQL